MSSSFHLLRHLQIRDIQLEITLSSRMFGEALMQVETESEGSLELVF
jgi:hypothetical protein